MPYATSFERLTRIMNDLRLSCPWDRKQTIETLRPLTIEETYELADAITDSDWSGLKEELGDLLLHIVFYAKIAEEEKQFRIEDVIEGVCNKLVHRHPHIYADTHVKDEEEVKRNWENLKIKEGKKSTLSGVPHALPAVVKALRLQEKAKQVGFEWEHAGQVMEKVKEELGEWEEAIASGVQQDIEMEFGDLMFSLINLARFQQIDPELALERCNKKFMNRFNRMEALLTTNGQLLTDFSLSEMDAAWNEIKQDE